jgi:hypothetical protein
MADVIRIVIKGESGYGPIDEAYTEKVTIDRESIRYEYRTMTKSNSVRKWSYKTNSPKFQKLFMEAGNAVDTVMNWKDVPFAMDIGATTFVITYADKTKRERDFFLSGDDFKDCYAIIKQMVPGCEDIPKVLKTTEDYNKTEQKLYH